MRLLIISISLFFTSYHLQVVAQDVETKKTTFGFEIGLNNSLLQMSEIPEDANKLNGTGVLLGILMNHSLNPTFSYVTKLEFAQNRNSFPYANPDGIYYSYYIMYSSLNWVNHMQYQLNDGEVKPYVLLGPNVKIPHTMDDGFTVSYSSVVDIALDFGVGFHKKLKHFNISPELKYSLGLMDVNNNPRYGSAYLHNISFVIQFSG